MTNVSIHYDNLDEIVNTLAADFPQLVRGDVEQLYLELRDGEGWGESTAEDFRDNFEGIYPDWKAFITDFVDEHIFGGGDYHQWGTAYFDYEKFGGDIKQDYFDIPLRHGCGIAVFRYP